MNEPQKHDQKHGPELDLPPPPGYRQLVAFSREAFAGLGRRRESPHAFAREMNSVLVMAAEFFHAARFYPIVFGRESATGNYLPVAVTGLEDRQNLFVNSDGHWRHDAYLPAYIRRWPFYTVKMKDADRVLVCVDPVGLERNDHPFLDADGLPTPHWQDTEKLMHEMDNARLNTQAFASALADMQLLDSFEAHALAKRGGNLRLANMYRVNEERLNKLSDKQLRQLMQKGFLSRIYAHLMSLENFQRLLDLRLERDTHEGEA